jgi:flagella basal body P-ring formation protein FlgA
VEVTLGAIDSRLRLAPCGQVAPYWPAGQRVLGLARVGLRCNDGPVRWNVFLPVKIRVWDQALVASAALPAGTTLAAEHLRSAEVDLLAKPDAAVTDATWALGRQLAMSLAEGQSLRMGDLRLRQWVKPGETVRVLARGENFQIGAEAQALSPALEGQPVRVRFESGRILQGTATGERQVTVPL